MAENAIMVCLIAYIAICIAIILSSNQTKLENAYYHDGRMIWETISD